MTSKKPPEPDRLSDADANRRATDALRHALTTPYKPQKEMVGKVGRKKQPKRDDAD